MNLKQLFTVAIATAISVAANAEDAARPLIAGHRGSNVGVENTIESFTTGGQRGYDFLETDIKVTADGGYVCSHDDDTKRLGGTLTIASSTVEQLQSEELNQTRDGVAYTGRLATLGDLLDVCTQYNCRPLIELKWATGINSNDCSGIPALIKYLEDKGYRDKCIILTSMKPCLEYIRTNYPDVELQFLTGQYWANHFEWCVEHKIDVDIQAGYFDKSTVRKFHDAGLKVNMWTTNDAAGYRTYGNMGCDFITTDKLIPAELPDLDPEIVLTPNTVDFPETDFTVKASYDPIPVANGIWPETIDAAAVRRAVQRGGLWYVLTRTDSGTAINVIDAVIGSITKTLPAPATLNDIAFTADGALLGCDLAIVPFDGGGDAMHIYRIGTEDNTATPEVLFTADQGRQLGNWTKSSAGHSMAVSGTLDDLKVYIATRSASATSYRIAGLHIVDGALTTNVYALDGTYNQTRWGVDNFRMNITPSSRDNILVSGIDASTTEYIFNWEGTRLPMTLYTEDHTEGNLAYSWIRLGEKVYALCGNVDKSTGSATYTLYDATDGLDYMTAVTPTMVVADNATSAMFTSVEKKGEDLMLYALVPGCGTMAQTIRGDSDGIILPYSDTDAPVEYYNLSGRRIESPTSGVYIRRQGTQASKVAVR